MPETPMDRNDSLLLESSYRELLRRVKKHGKFFPKRHGNWVRLPLFGDLSITLDTWNSAMWLMRGDGEYNQWTGFAGETVKYLGIDFGGFENKEPETVTALNTGITAIMKATGHE